MLEVTDVCYHFEQPLSEQFTFSDNLLKNINFSVPNGKILHIRGENGAGKTTLLKIIAGFIRPQEGRIRIQGVSLEHNKLDYQKNICYVGHQLGIHSKLTPKEHFLLDLQQDIKAKDWVNYAQNFSLQKIENIPIDFLSAGQRRRLSLLRILFSTAKVWLLDEPFVALDEAGVVFVQQAVHKHLHSGGIVLLTSHQSIPFANDTCMEYWL